MACGVWAAVLSRKWGGAGVFLGVIFGPVSLAGEVSDELRRRKDYSERLKTWGEGRAAELTVIRVWKAKVLAAVKESE